MLLRETLFNARKEGYEVGRQEGRQKGIQKGIQESIIHLLKRFGDVPADLRMCIAEETDETVLKRWLLSAAAAVSMEDFRKEM